MDMRGPEETGTVRTEASGRRRQALGVGVTLALVAALVAGFGALAVSKNALTLPSQVALGSTASWQVYHDPLGLFTVRVPPGWTSHSSEQGTYTEGNRQGRFTGQDENATFSDPTRGAGSTTLGVYVMQIPDSPVAAAMNCSERVHETATFNGYPADTTTHGVILFESANAHFQIGETIPGVIVPVGPTSLNPPPPPTAAPAATVTADKALIAAMLASFQPTDPHPLACH